MFQTVLHWLVPKYLSNRDQSIIKKYTEIYIFKEFKKYI